MAKKKSRRKTYNPAKNKDRALAHRAAKCFLYRWNETSKYAHGYLSYGPYKEDEHGALMDWALNRSTRWIVSVVACFLDAQGDYYEEYLSTTIGPYKLGDNPPEFQEILESVKVQARDAGNPNHYVDTCIMLCPYTDRLNARIESDAWVKKQAGYRADVIRKSHHSDERSPVAV